MLDLEETIEKLVNDIQTLNENLRVIIEQNRSIIDLQKRMIDHTKNGSFSVYNESLVVPDALTLLSLPSSYRKTLVTLYRLGKGTAMDIAKETERKRAVESAYANRLVRLGFIKKRKEGRKTVFYRNSREEVKV